MPTVFANMRSITHQGDGFTQTCAVPDVCKTPTPAGPVPIPYVNVAMDANLASGSQQVKVEGSPAALAGSNLSVSSGDEAGVAGGVVSGKNLGKLTWGSYSVDVKIEGKGVVRFLDVTQHNGNTFNSAFIGMGLPGGAVGTGWAYGDDPTSGTDPDLEQCPECGKSKSSHRLHSSDTSKARVLALATELTRLRNADQRQLAGDEGKGDVFPGQYETVQQFVITKGQDGKKTKDFVDVQRWKGSTAFMMGVLICDDDTEYAAMSGEGGPSNGFKQAATNLGMTWCDVINMNALRNGRGQITDPTDKYKKAPRSSVPGMCAAPKLLQKARADGKTPLFMTEIWYSPLAINKAVKVAFVKREAIDDEGEVIKVTQVQEKDQEAQFKHLEVVPSCDTCKIGVTLMLCEPEG